MLKLVNLLAVTLMSLLSTISNAQHCPERAEASDCSAMLLEYSELQLKYSAILSQLEEDLTAAKTRGDHAEISRLENDIQRYSRLAQTWKDSYEALSTFLGESLHNLNEIDTTMDAIARARNAGNYNMVAILSEPLEDLLRNALMIYEVFNDRDNTLKILQLISTVDDMLTQCAEEAKKLGDIDSSRKLSSEAGIQARLAAWKTRFMERAADMATPPPVTAGESPDPEAETERKDQTDSLLMEALHSVRPTQRANDTENAADPPSKRKKASQTKQAANIPQQIVFHPRHSK